MSLEHFCFLVRAINAENQLLIQSHSLRVVAFAGLKHEPGRVLFVSRKLLSLVNGVTTANPTQALERARSEPSLRYLKLPTA